jgi:DNA modification methylase
MRDWDLNWQRFKRELPFTEAPYNKRNWGNNNHSLCSFYGKLKPAISHFLIETFTNVGDLLLDPFSGSGTIPFEGALNRRNTFAMDINPISVVITSAKVKKITLMELQNEFDKLSTYIKSNTPHNDVLIKASSFGYNRTLGEYFHETTFLEILNAREYFRIHKIDNPAKYFIVTCLLHILHGNRPYALSRTSHPITPYAPSGEFEYKNLMNKLYQKMDRAFKESEKFELTEGQVFQADILEPWPSPIQNINAIITSPPFFDSTKYYMTNWLRSWFLGWEKEDFEVEKHKFVDTKQKKSFDVYDTILGNAKERLTKDGLIVFHLGKSHKKDMAKAILPYAKKYFKNVEIFNEDVSNVEKHGVMDKGSVSIHQYLLMH